MTSENVQALVVGSGPAGLMAAEQMSATGMRVVVAEAKPSIGRKLLMAGKSGLNLTKDESNDRFLSAYSDAAPYLAPMLAEFGPHEVRQWAEGLGQSVFTGSSGRVFPDAMKASPILRAWALRLFEAGVDIRTRWRWTGWRDGQTLFESPDGAVAISADVTILALGGASWSRLGSDGRWSEIFAGNGIDVVPFRPANAGIRVEWSNPMRRHFGAPLKGIRLQAGKQSVRAECILSERGLEGGGIYAVSRAVRDGAPLTFDLLPDWSPEKISLRLAKARKSDSRSNQLRKLLGLDPAKLAIFQEFARPLPSDPDVLAGLLKSLPIRHEGLRPLDEAISTAGGVAWGSVLPTLALKARLDVFVAGEMLDWEAPTGGYLITGCLATGRHAGRAAAGVA